VPTPTLLRREVAALAATAAHDLDILWRGADSPAELEAALRDTLPPLIDTYGLAAASVAADWYDELRDENGVRGRFAAIVPEVGDAGAQALVGWALTEANDLPAFQTLIVGGTQRRIANASRATVAGSSIADPGARGWYRVGDGDSCEFCSMLLGRGAVYTEATADFQAHDHCGCAAAPKWA
jgi:hypothetical protein